VLQLALLKATGSVIASAAIALLLLGTPELRESAQSLLSESLFISLLILHCAAAALVFATRCRRACILLAVTAAAMVSVRPAGYFVVGSILLLPIFWSGARRHVLIWACVPLVVTMGLITIADRLVRGVGGSSNAGYALLPHVAYLNKPNSGYLPPDADSAVMSYVLPYQALRSSGVPWHELQVIEANNFNPLMHSVQDQFRDERAARSAALRLIRSDPFGYVEIVAMNLYMGLWAYTLINVPDHGRLLQQRYATDLVNMQAQYPSIGQSVDGQYLTDERNHFILRDDYWMPTLILSTTERNGVLIIYLAAALFSVVRFFRFHRLPPTVKLSAYLAVASLGGYLLVALSTVFILRYGVPLGALVLIVVVLELLNLSRWLRVRSGQIRSVDLLEHVVRGALQQAR
jgi:hypothetical protein